MIDLICNYYKVVKRIKMEKAKKVLEQKGLRATIHRIMILSYLMETKAHPDIDTIYSEMLKKIPTISKTTIYNTLSSLVEYKLVDEIDLPQGPRFDYRDKEHAHFYCKLCGKIYDLDLPIPQKPDYCEGHKVETIQYLYIGICKECLKKHKEENI